MTIQSYKMGPGTLDLGTDPADLDVSAQVRSLVVRAAERVTSTESVPVLSGEELEGDESVDFDWSMVGNVIQDLSATGLTDWTWANAGTPVAFAFTPSTAAGRTVTGTVVPTPLDVGGDVDKTKRPEAGFTWRIKGTPVLT